MARTIKDSKLDSRTARALLLAQDKPHWRMIEEGFHIGYRKGARGGKWQGRIFVNGRYVEKSLGTADDTADADGAIILAWTHALAAGRAWREKALRVARGHDTAQANYAVQDAFNDYIADYVRRGGKAERGLRGTFRLHIIPAFGTTEVERLTAKKIKDWHFGLMSAPGKTRGGKDRIGDVDLRSRKATANRILTCFKAALNYAFAEGHVDVDTAWRRVKPFKDVETARVRYLSLDEQRRLVNACEPSFRSLVRGALFTGCRYGELCRLRVADIDLDSRTSFIGITKSGKPRHVVLTDEATDFFKSMVAGRAGTELVFQMNGRQWQESEQSRPMGAASLGAKIAPRIKFHDLRHTHASSLAMAGVPMGVIAAQLGHSDTRVTERHYAHLSPSYVADTIRQNFPKLGIGDKTNVTTIASAR